eukprot:sb/3462234/
MSVSFAELLQSAEQLNADTASSTSLPRVHRNLGQIAEAGERLWMKTAAMATDDSADVKASILLGSRGFDVPSMAQKMETLKTTSIEPSESSSVTDITGFLKSEREQALLSAIIESKSSTIKSATQRHSQALQMQWEAEKERVLSALLGSTKTEVHVPLDLQPLSVNSSFWGKDAAMGQDEVSYSEVISRRNEAVIAGRRYPLIDEFIHTIQQFGESKAVLDCWELVEVLVNSVSFDDPALRFKPTNTMDLLRRSVEYLERGFVQFVQTTICGQLEVAELGGVPGVMELASSYLSVRSQEVSVWGLVFVCLRCGSPAAALKVLQNDGYEGEIETILENWANLSQPTAARDKVRQLYYGGVNGCGDPYKRLVFSILGGCDIERRHGDILSTVQDYIWLKLVHVLTCHGAGRDFRSNKDKVTLSEVQEHVLKEYGENHFSSLNSPYLYALVLLLTGLYESAIEVLYRGEESRANAIHLALTLHSHGLLNISLSPHLPILSESDEDPTPHRRLNLCRIVIGYTRKFACSSPTSALNYYYLLHGIQNEEGEDMFAVCIADLIQESKEYRTLLGYLDSTGRKTKGAIDRFNVNHSLIICTVAEAAEKRGCWEEAVTLYELASNYEKVLEILIEELSRRFMSNDKGHEHVHQIACDVEKRAHHVSLRKQFLLLLDLYQFHNLYHAGKLEEALDVITKLQLVPLSQDAISHRIQGFKSFSDELRRCVPDILIMVMSILNKMYRGASQNSTSFYGGQNKQAQQIRDQAKVVMRFAGMLPYSMPGDTHAQLSLLDAPMRY